MECQASVKRIKTMPVSYSGGYCQVEERSYCMLTSMSVKGGYKETIKQCPEVGGSVSGKRVLSCVSQRGCPCRGLAPGLERGL